MWSHQFIQLDLQVPEPATDAPVPDRQKRGGLKPLSKSRIERDGLKAGTVAPEFTLPDIYGRSISLEQYRGRRVFLVFSDPHCGPCTELAPHLVHAHRRRRTGSADIVVVSRGDREENRRKAEAHGFEFPVVLQDRWKLSRKYGIFATPVAFLIGEDGRTVREVAVGSEQIQALLLEEFKRGPVQGLVETVDDISRVLSSPIHRRDAFRVAVRIAAVAAFSVIGLQKVAFAVCGTGEITCGTNCCNGSTQKCCTSVCCSTGVACCGAKCCAPTEICSGGQCRQPPPP